MPDPRPPPHSATAGRTRRRWRALGIAVAIVAVIIAIGCMPTEEVIAPATVVSVSVEPAIRPGVVVTWYDLDLHAQRYRSKHPLGDQRSLQVPALSVATRRWRVWRKRLLSSLNAYSACEHCFGPYATYALYQEGDWRPPAGFRVVQNQSRDATGVHLVASLLADVSTQPERPFAPRDLVALLGECRRLLSDGVVADLPATRWGPELAALNPVRVEVVATAVLAWMGGKRGYALVPEGGGCPAVSGAMMSGTEHAGVYTLDRW